MQNLNQINDQELDNVVMEFFANYQDPGMKKWGGFRLSEHIERLDIEKDKNSSK
jgi:hypothetical protein